MRNGTELPPRWEERPLGDLFDVLDSRRVPVNARERATRQGNIPYYGATGQVGWIDDFLYDEELVLLGEDGAPFLEGLKPKAYIIRGKTWVNNHAHVLRALGGTPSSFWKSQLDQVQYRPYVSGTTRLKLPQAPMRAIPLRVPPVDEQWRIAEAVDSYFTRLDDAEATLERVKRNLVRYRASVLQAAVEGRLVPTEAELSRADGRPFEHASAFLKRLAASRSQSRGDKVTDSSTSAPSHGAPLPDGWCWATVDELSQDIRYGTSARSSRLEESAIPVLRMGNIAAGVLRFNNLKFLPSVHPEFPELLLRPGDLLFNRTNSPELVGKSAVFHGYSSRCSFASYLIRVRLLAEVNPDYLACFLNSHSGRRWIAAVVSQQVGQANVNGSKLKACVFPLPPADEQIRIVAEIDRLISGASALEHAVELGLRRVRTLRGSILQVAFQGRLVDQDPTDEPASVLLDRIRTERAKAASSPETPLRRSRPRKAVKK